MYHENTGDGPLYTCVLISIFLSPCMHARVCVCVCVYVRVCVWAVQLRGILSFICFRTQNRRRVVPSRASSQKASFTLRALLFLSLLCAHMDKHGVLGGQERPSERSSPLRVCIPVKTQEDKYKSGFSCFSSPHPLTLLPPTFNIWKTLIWQHPVEATEASEILCDVFPPLLCVFSFSTSGFSLHPFPLSLSTVSPPLRVCGGLLAALLSG